MRLLIVAILIGAAIGFHWYAGGVSFVAYNVASGNAIVTKAYKACYEKKNSGAIESTGIECIAHLINYAMQAGASVATGGYAVGTFESGFGNSQQTESDVPPENEKRGIEQHHRSVLDSFNEPLAHMESGLRALRVKKSHVHPDDGLAVKLNVRGGGGALHMHTNGTHAMMLFDDDDTEDEDAGAAANKAIAPAHPHSRRDFLATENHFYEFHDAAVHGFKVQAHNVNAPKGAKRAKDYTKAVEMFAQYHSPFVNENQPAMWNSDRWTFQFCDKKGTESYFYGMIIAEESKAGNGYEHMGEPGCYQGGEV